MNRKFRKKYRIFLICFLFAAIFTGMGMYINYLQESIPDNIYLDTFSDDAIDIDVPFVGTVQTNDGSEDVVTASVNLMEPLRIDSGEAKKCNIKVNLLGILPIKEIDVDVTASKKVAVMGIPIGIYIKTAGVMVVDVGEVKDETGLNNAPSKGIILPGDYILSVDGVEINNKNQLVEIISKGTNEYREIRIRRNGNIIEVKVRPAYDENNLLKLGIWVKDDCQGLGTMTYVDEDGKFATLGHAISDNKTNKCVEIQSGRIYTAKIWSVVKGKSGNPGEVIGSINYGDENYLGDITINNSTGVYGNSAQSLQSLINEPYMGVAYKQDIKKDKAYVRTFISGEVKDYEIEIEEVNFSREDYNKGIVFSVTDKSLLNITNGIVQGMSGSPIIQNGKIIGAVTHVFVNAPEKGYGIFIENMLHNK